VSAGMFAGGEVPRPGMFDENLDLVCGISRHLGVGEDAIRNGILAVEQDVGEFTCWRYRSEGLSGTEGTEGSEKECFLVNGFAANDPLSTEAVLRKVIDLLPPDRGELTGLLNLRLDRGDRTIQWIEALRAGWRERFRRLYVTGGHARALARRLPDVRLVTMTDPEELTRLVVSEANDRDVIFGFGNFHGMGERLVEHWSRNGAPGGV